MPLNKILFAGPVGAGKTSAINVVSDSPVVATEAGASEDLGPGKHQTTVAMDYGTLAIDDELTIQLVGSPGQVRFDFMWEILAQGAMGLVLLVNHARPDRVDDLERYLDAFSSLLDQQQTACVVGVTCCDLAGDNSLEPYHDFLARSERNIPVLEVDARSRADVKTALLTLASMLAPRGQRSRTA